MNIISSVNNSKMHGLGSAFQASNINFAFWNPAIKPTLDMFFEFKPEILFISTLEDDEALKIAREKYPKTNIINIDIQKIEPKADLINYLGGVKQDKYKAMGGMFTYNCKDKPVMPGFLEGKTKIWGSEKYDFPNYVGEIKLEERKHAIASCGDFICYSEEEIFAAFLNKTTPIIYLDENKKFLQYGASMDEAFKLAINHSYLHTAAELLTQLNFTEESKQCPLIHAKLLEKHNVKI